MLKCIMVKIGGESKRRKLNENSGKFINFAEIGGHFINFAEIGREIYKFSGNRVEYAKCIIGVYGNGRPC